MPEQLNTSTTSSAWGGILLSILGNISWQNLTQTIVLAIVGTIVSFFTSALLEKISTRFKKR